MFNKVLERLCEEVHDRYEAAASVVGWKTQAKSAVPWEQVPEMNKETMRRALAPIADRTSFLEREAAAHVIHLEWRETKHREVYAKMESLQVKLGRLEKALEKKTTEAAQFKGSWEAALGMSLYFRTLLDKHGIPWLGRDNG